MTSKPHILIIPGMWHVAHHWRLFKAAIQNAGYQATVQNLAANVEDGTVPVEDAMAKGVAAIRAAALKLIEKGNDVVVVAHSAGGAAAGGALGRLGKVGWVDMDPLFEGIYLLTEVVWRQVEARCSAHRLSGSLSDRTWRQS